MVIPSFRIQLHEDSIGSILLPDLEFRVFRAAAAFLQKQRIAGLILDRWWVDDGHWWSVMIIDSTSGEFMWIPSGLRMSKGQRLASQEAPQQHGNCSSEKTGTATAARLKKLRMAWPPAQQTERQVKKAKETRQKRTTSFNKCAVFNCFIRLSYFDVFCPTMPLTTTSQRLHWSQV